MSGQILGQFAAYLSQESAGLPTVNADLNELLIALSNERRRIVIDVLSQVGDEGIELGELAERVAAVQEGKPQERVTSQERHRVYVGLKKCHIEKVVGAGLAQAVDRDVKYAPTEDTFPVSTIVAELRSVAGGDD